jgi:transglutaminase-like putative cysteine protease
VRARYHASATYVGPFVIALLRAMDVPARYVACYAPRLDPMDFHAVAEVLVEGEWSVVDATRLAPRTSLVRIGTGRDAADCAFLSYHGGYVGLERLEVDATVKDAPETVDDHASLVSMS